MIYVVLLCVTLIFFLSGAIHILSRLITRLTLKVRRVKSPPLRLASAQFVRFFFRGPTLIQVAA
jgi:hypothetical protein